METTPSGEKLGVYCQNMPCLDHKISLLHQLSHDWKQDNAQNVDRYLYLCGMVDHCSLKGSLGASSSNVQRFGVTCLCNDPNHTIFFAKVIVSVSLLSPHMT